MTVSRRKLFGALAFTAGCGPAVEAAESGIPLDVLRNVAWAHGIDLSDDRLRVIKPVLEHRQAQLRALREFEAGDTVAPAQGVLDK
jgi:hypothetical protein